jgi:ankyrin repeat protein
VAKLLEEGADANEGGGAPLLQAAETGDTGIAKLLLDEGADINGRDGQGTTPLHLAACCGHVEMVKLLLANGANANARGVKGHTPLHLIADLGVTHAYTLFAPLEDSARVHRFEVVTAILEAYGGTI